MAAKQLDVGAVIDEAPFSGYQKSVVAFCAVLALVDTYDTQSMSYAASSVAKEWNVGVQAITPVFALALVGMLVGGLGFGPLADRLGRRRTILLSTLIFGVTTLIIPFVHTVDQLLVVRFITGIGVGGIYSNLMSMGAEYAPKRIRTTVTTCIGAGMILGGFFGGFLAAWLIPAAGWRSVFIVGGVLALVLTVIAALWLPESVRFLTVRGRADQARRIVARIDPSRDLSDVVLVASSVDERTKKRSPVTSLFRDGRATLTLLMWLCFSLVGLVMYFLLNWLPSLLVLTGLSQTLSLMATALFSLGGAIGGVTIGLLSDRTRHPLRVLLVSAAIATVIIAAVPLFLGTGSLVFVFAFVAGLGVCGSQIGVSAFGALAYPTAIRATGAGWAQGVGRVGSIFGPTLGGILIGVGVSAQSTIMLAAIPAVLLVAALLALLLAGNRRDVADEGTVSLGAEAVAGGN